MKLRIVVCIKPVPDPAKWDKLKLDPETMLLCRNEIPAVINPLDRTAIEQAVSLKEKFGATVSVLTMAVPDAEEQLREALAMGCDRACLLTDKAFAGADTLATARVIAAAVRKLGRFDLIFCGGYSLDGSTSQVGPQVAELLDIPELTHVFKLKLRGGALEAHCRLESGHAVYAAQLPALLTLDKEANSPRLADMRGIGRAVGKSVTRWSARDLKLSPSKVGLKGSPTQMLNVYTPAVGRKGEILQGTADEAVCELIVRLQKEKVL
ncbi:MAG: electron transfer flavoprotein subunit beta/FixA family protein [Elusimicrobiota bacterium]